MPASACQHTSSTFPSYVPPYLYSPWASELEPVPAVRDTEPEPEPDPEARTHQAHQLACPPPPAYLPGHSPSTITGVTALHTIDLHLNRLIGLLSFAQAAFPQSHRLRCCVRICTSGPSPRLSAWPKQPTTAPVKSTNHRFRISSSSTSKLRPPSSRATNPPRPCPACLAVGLDIRLSTTRRHQLSNCCLVRGRSSCRWLKPCGSLVG